MKRLILWLILSSTTMTGFGQTVINAFAKVTSITGTTLNVSNVDETNDTFLVGESIIIMQMQGDVIGSNTNDDASFGDLSDIGSVGLYEDAEILSVDRSSGLVSITVSTALVNSYSTDANSSVQVISFPRFTDYTSPDDLTTIAWNGDIGGVFAIDVTNTLTLENNISVDGMGFRGGGIHATGSGAGCDPNTYITSSNQFGWKGEGIYKSSNANYNYGRGKILTGGGGGNPHNAGGGGGGNFTTGGVGGPGYDGSADGCGPSAGGLGGLDVSEHVSASQIFLGGGGGGGQQNNNVATEGGNGGGIIIIRSDEIELAACSGYTISANGESSGDAGNDGVGGSGAGGTILFQVNSWSLGCNLTVQVNGGDGGAVGDGAAHGGGGGGGKGVMLFSGVAPITNVTLENSQGSGGSNSNNASSGSAEEGGSTPSDPEADQDGIVEEEAGGPLPVELMYWKAETHKEQVLLRWATATEINNDFFTIEKSKDSEDWSVLVQMNGAGNSNEPMYYDFLDDKPFSGVVYYRLSQTDYDGTMEIFEVREIESDWAGKNVLLYPNPNKGLFRLKFEAEDYQLTLFDSQGQAYKPHTVYADGELEVDIQNIPIGVYYVRLVFGETNRTFQMVINE